MRDLRRPLPALFLLMQVLMLALLASLSLAAESSGGAKSNAPAARQSAGSTLGALGALGALVPSLIANVAPLVLLFGLGALVMPALGMGAMGLLRDGRRSSSGVAEQALPQFGLPNAFAQYTRPLHTSPQEIYYFTKRSLPSSWPQINSASLASGLNEILMRVGRAIENADKRYE